MVRVTSEWLHYKYESGWRIECGCKSIFVDGRLTTVLVSTLLCVSPLAMTVDEDSRNSAPNPGNLLDRADFVDFNCECPKPLLPEAAQAFMGYLLVSPAALTSPGPVSVA